MVFLCTVLVSTQEMQKDKDVLKHSYEIESKQNLFRASNFKSVRDPKTQFLKTLSHGLYIADPTFGSYRKIYFGIPKFADALDKGYLAKGYPAKPYFGQSYPPRSSLRSPKIRH